MSEHLSDAELDELSSLLASQRMNFADRKRVREVFAAYRELRDRDRAAKTPPLPYEGMYEVGELAGVRLFADVRGSTSGANMVRAALMALKSLPAAATKDEGGAS